MINSKKTVYKRHMRLKMPLCTLIEWKCSKFLCGKEETAKKEIF